MSEEKNTNWWIYIVETSRGIWYTGISTDVPRRVAQHELGKGAKNLRGKGPLKLIFKASVGTKSEASILEYKVKQLSKQKKRQWVESGSLNTSLTNNKISDTAP